MVRPVSPLGVMTTHEPENVTSKHPPSDPGRIIGVDEPFPGSRLAHRIASECSVTLINIAPVDTVGDLPVRKPRAYLCTRQLAKIVRGGMCGLPVRGQQPAADEESQRNRPSARAHVGMSPSLHEKWKCGLRSDMLRPWAKTWTRFLGMSPRGEIAFPKSQPSAKCVILSI
jgi:hypothetical protein